MNHAQRWDERYAAEGLTWSAGPNVFVAAEVGPPPSGPGAPPARALDVACGEGRHAIWLAEQGWDVVAVDFSRVGLDKGTALAAQRGVEVTWVHADVAEWTPPQEAFGLVLVAYLHTDAETLRNALRRSEDAVAPGGVLLAVGHDAANLEHGHGGPQDPSVLWTAEGIAAHLDRLVVERAGQARRTVETPEGEATAIDTLVRARRR